MTERAAIPGVEVMFEAAGGRYAWLNNVTAWTMATVPEDGVIRLKFWRVSFFFPVLFFPRGVAGWTENTETRVKGSR